MQGPENGFASGGGEGLCERVSVSKLGGFEGILPRENFKSKNANIVIITSAHTEQLSVTRTFLSQIL